MSLEVIKGGKSESPELFTFPTWWGGTRTSANMPGAAPKLKRLRGRVGGLKAVAKEGVKFKVKDAATLMRKVRSAADKLQINIVPKAVRGIPLDVKSGTAAAVEIVFELQDLEDGSVCHFAGYGVGADSQDKAGGKAFTYCWKSALIYALLLVDGDMPDCDDDSEPGGKKGLQRGPNEVSPADNEATVRALETRIKAADTLEVLKGILAEATTAREAGQLSAQEAIRLHAAAKRRNTALKEQT